MWRSRQVSSLSKEGTVVCGAPKAGHCGDSWRILGCQVGLGGHSPPMVRSVAAIHLSLEIPLLIPKEKPPITVVGDVGGRITIIVDDIIGNVDSFLAAAETLKERGAYKIFVMETHGLLSSDAP